MVTCKKLKEYLKISASVSVIQRELKEIGFRYRKLKKFHFCQQQTKEIE